MMPVFKGRKIGKYLPGFFTFLDLVVVNLLFALSLVFYPDVAHSPRIRTIWVMVNVSCVPMLFKFFNAANFHRARTMDQVARDAFMLVGMHALCFSSLLTFVGIILPIREYVLFYCMMGVGVPFWWLLSRTILKYLRSKGYNFVRVAIVGTGPLAERLLEELGSNAGFGYKVMGFFSDNPYPEFPERVAGNLDDLGRIAAEGNIDQIFFTITGADEKKLSKVIKIADDNMVQLYYVPQISRKVARNFELHSVGAMPVLSVRRNPLSSVINRTVKRTFDIIFSSLFLIVSPIVFIPVIIAIKLSSPGPIFFVQERTGYKGRTFKCLKFRTMRVNSDADKVQATQGDPRVTRVGRFLRHTSIDELPQFINVLLGSMSVVGPRPHMVKHTEEYAKLIGPYMVRHIVRPGITGWAQVNGYRGITDELWKMERRVEHDVWYIEHWSFLLDLKIVVRTVINGFSGEENAY